MQPDQQNPISIEMMRSHSGPLPPPEQLERYEKVHPGLAERIIQLTEGEAAHRRQLDLKIVGDLDRERQERRIGQFCAVIVTFIALVSATICAVKGAQITGSIIGGATVTAIAAAFLTRRHSPRNHSEPTVQSDPELKPAEQSKLIP